MKRWFCLIAALLLLPMMGCQPKGRLHALSFSSMDTMMSLQIQGDEALLQESRQVISEVENRYSRTLDSSLVSRLNRGETVEDEAMAAWLRNVQSLSEQTRRAFDITVAPVVSAWGFTTDQYQIPTEEQLKTLLEKVGPEFLTISGNSLSLAEGCGMDLGGVAKGYASDAVAQLWKQRGVASGLAALGGNILSVGTKPDGTPWKVGVRNPWDPSGYLGILTEPDGTTFTVTSGTYERYFVGPDGKTYHHIIDPRTGYPANSGLVSVTLMGSCGWLCDECSTAFLVLGKEAAIELFSSMEELTGMILVTEEGNVYYSSGIPWDSATEFSGEGLVYECFS